MAATQEEIIAGLAEIIEEVTGIEPSEVTIEKSFVDDLDIDSLSMVEIAVQTEDKYGVKIPDEDLASLRTVGDAVDLHPEARGRGRDAEAVKAKLELPATRSELSRDFPSPTGTFPNVVVTSLAASTSIAGDVDATWKGLLAGESGIDVLDEPSSTEYDLPVRIGGHAEGEPRRVADPGRDPADELRRAAGARARPSGLGERRQPGGRQGPARRRHRHRTRWRRGADRRRRQDAGPADTARCRRSPCRW